MCEGGDYRFTVYVANIFDPQLKINIDVIHYHCRRYHLHYGKKKGITEEKKTKFKHKIRGGYRLGFPMFKGDEYLEISCDKQKTLNDALEEGVTDNCIIKAGHRAKVYLDPADIEKWEYTDMGHGKGEDDYGTFYNGGHFSPLKDNKNWKITIRKYDPDPASDNVTVGPDTP